MLLLVTRSVMSQATRLRELIAAPELLVTPGAVDALSARLVEAAGFESVYLGGYSMGAATAITEPMMTLTETCDRAREVARASDVPLVVDGNAGFGNPTHTYRAVREFASAGVAGVHIEDQVYPKRLHYHSGIKRIVDRAEMERKIETAARANDEQDGDVVLIARTDAGRDQRRTEEGETIEDAVVRMNAYLDAGAEVGMVFPSSIDELQFAIDEVDGPVLFPLIENYEPAPPTDALESMGLDWCVFPLSASVVLTRTLKELYRDIRRDGTSGLESDEVDRIRTEIETLIDLPALYDIEERAGNK